MRQTTFTFAAIAIAAALAGCAKPSPSPSTPAVDDAPLLTREQIVNSEYGPMLIVQFPQNEAEPELIYDQKNGNWSAVQPIGRDWPNHTEATWTKR